MSAWTPERYFYFFIGLAYLVVWLQASSYWRGGFRPRLLLAAPFLASMAFFLTFMPSGSRNAFIVSFFALATLGGLWGICEHLRGVRPYVGSWSLRNFMVGPPLAPPAILSTLSAIMLLVCLA